MDIPLAQQLDNKIQELETGDAKLKESMSELILHSNRQGFRFESQSKVTEESRSANPWRVGKHSDISNHNLRNNPPRGSINFTNEQYVNILQSMGEGLHIIDPEGLIVYWNRASEQIFGYSASEALGQNINGFIVEKQDLSAANEIIEKNSSGENWTGIFPARNKQGQQFEVLVTTAPLYDDRGTLVGIICVTIASESIQETTEPVSLGTKPSEDDTYPSSSWLRNSGPTTTRHVLDPCHRPLKAVIPSKISKLVIAAVGFMDQRNEIPKDTDLTWASLIKSCCHSDPKCRPTFAEVLEKLKILQRHYFVQKPTYIGPRRLPL
ncbi:hypothetical protein MKX03_036037 [Papaver bracteatum]|nr:hypothetical protein MKX03_036037 [Papaver bracteatum]